MSQKRAFSVLNDSVAQAIVKKGVIFNDSKNLLSKKALFLTIADGGCELTNLTTFEFHDIINI